MRWLEDLEYNKVGLPRPTQVVYLDMAPKVSQLLLKQRYHGDESKKDIHEANFAYLQHCRDAALYAAQKFGWTVISCCQGEAVRSMEEMSQEVWQAVQHHF